MKNLPLRLLIWDRDPTACRAIEQAAEELGHNLAAARTLSEMQTMLASAPPPDLLLADLSTLLTSPESTLQELLSPTSPIPTAVMTDLRPEEYIHTVRRLRIFHLLVKSEPPVPAELNLLLHCAVNPRDGFGLVLHFEHTLELYSLTVRTRPDKNEAIERVINYFATNGFNIHKLYNVRLILEELLNNALFHAFHDSAGREKYRMSDFSSLEAEEQVRVDFGNSGDVVGFSITDNAGTLTPEVVLEKMARQHTREGLLDVSGRGLHLSRMLTSNLFINIEEGQRTQIAALFREREDSGRLKPLTINYVAARRYWRQARQPSDVSRMPCIPGTSVASLVPPPSNADLHEDFD
jgi:anti-sigma regulatory factor (Ser/Thr protein kinase)/CheY-like chemotaxis protein